MAYPLDTVKTRMQTSRAGTGGAALQTFTTAVRQDGVLSLYRCVGGAGGNNPL